MKSRRIGVSGCARRALRAARGLPVGWSTFALLACALLAAPPPARAIWPFRRAAPEVSAADLGSTAAGLLSQAIRIRSVNPPGDERPVAELYLRFLAERGIAARLIETPGSGSPLGRAAVWARLAGSGARRPIVLLSHLDVVPAGDGQWAFGPFEGVIGGGQVVGRGALDAKGISVVHLLTLAELERRGIELDRDVIFLATPDEEMGGASGAGYIASERRELLLDAEYLLTEGGGIRVADGDSPPIWGVSFTEKSPCWLEVTARGRPGHSATAAPDAAVPRLIAALDRVRRFETGIRVVPEVQRMFAALAPIAPPEDRIPFRSLATFLENDPTFRGRFLADRSHAALVRNTVAITVLEGGPRTNVSPAEAHAHLDVRLLPGENCLAVSDEIRLAIADLRVEVRSLLSLEANSSPVDTELFEAIRRVALDVEPEARVIPRLISGFTDAHYFRDLGIVAYGFVPRWLPPHETRGVHGVNERISVENLERGVETMLRILVELAGD